MEKLRTYGQPPFTVAVIHGGPGGPGGMAPVARELSAEWGILEPLQAATSVEGQVQELESVLKESANPPVTLIGSSWGAMLSFIFAARYPVSVKKLILVGSGVYEERYAARIMETRLGRLSDGERQEARSLVEILDDPSIADKNAPLARFNELLTKADAWDPLTLDTEVLEYQYHIHRSVWKEAAELRRGGGLLEFGRRIRCPVVAIHGDYDPHLPEGVEEPLRRVVADFRFLLLRNCGHLPWIEREARESFYQILRRELQ